jgi:hypothetical protein
MSFFAVKETYEFRGDANDKDAILDGFVVTTIYSRSHRTCLQVSGTLTWR